MIILQKGEVSMIRNLRCKNEPEEIQGKNFHVEVKIQ